MNMKSYKIKNIIGYISIFIVFFAVSITDHNYIDLLLPLLTFAITTILIFTPKKKYWGYYGIPMLGVALPLFLMSIGILAARAIPGCQVDIIETGCIVAGLDIGGLLGAFIYVGFPWLMFGSIISIFAVTVIWLIKN